MATKAWMLATVQPAANTLGIFLCSHATVGQRQQLHQTRFARLDQRFHVIGQHRLDGGILLPLGVIGGESLDLVDGELQLKGQRCLRPEGAVVVKDHIALVDRNKGAGTRLSRALHPSLDGLLGRGILPGRERVGSVFGIRTKCRAQDQGAENAV
ncbi:hypothetical protein D3C78_1131990 [compost metagenome]